MLQRVRLADQEWTPKFLPTPAFLGRRGRFSTQSVVIQLPDTPSSLISDSPIPIRRQRVRSGAVSKDYGQVWTVTVL